MVITTFLCRDLEEALEMGMDWSLREGVPLCPTCVCVCLYTNVHVLSVSGLLSLKSAL